MKSDKKPRWNSMLLVSHYKLLTCWQEYFPWIGPQGRICTSLFRCPYLKDDPAVLLRGVYLGNFTLMCLWTAAQLTTPFSLSLPLMKEYFKATCRVGKPNWIILALEICFTWRIAQGHQFVAACHWKMRFLPSSSKQASVCAVVNLWTSC